MRRLFSRKSTEDAKGGKGDGNEVTKKKSLFLVRHTSKKERTQPELERPQQQQPSVNLNLTTTTNDSTTPSSASSAVSIPPSAPYLPTPSGSSSSFSSVTSCSEAPSPCPELVVLPSIAPPSTSSKSLGSNTSTTSLNSINGSPKSGNVPSLSITPPPGLQSSHTEPRKPLSPLSVVVNLHSVHTPPPSDDEDEDFVPKRRNSIYNIFKKSHSQPNLGSNPPSRSSSTTTLPSTFNAPHASSASLSPSPTPHNLKKSVSFLRRKPSTHSNQEDAVELDGALSRNEATARRAILQGDPLGGGAYSYPMGLAHKSDSINRPPPPPSGSRTRRSAVGRIYDPRTSSWIGAGSYGNGGMAWRAPHIGGRNCARMTIEEENDMMEHQQYQLERQAVAGEFMEDAPQFERSQPQRFRPPSTRRPVSSQSWRTSSSSGYGYFHTNDQRPNYYPPFAPQQMLPVINQHSSQSSRA